MYRSFVSLGRYTPKYLILFVAMVNSIVSLIPLSVFSYSRILYDPPPRILEIKAKIHKWNLMKVKSFCTKKGNYKQGEKTVLRLGENNSK